MSWTSDDYRGSPKQLSPGSDERWYDECNWGVARFGGGGGGTTGSTVHRFNRETREAEAGANGSVLTNLSGQSQVGYLFEIDGDASDYDGLEIVFDATYNGLLELNGLAACSIKLEVAAIDDKADKWPSEDSSYKEDERTLLNKSFSNWAKTNAWNDSVYADDNPLYISDPSDGDKYRIVVGANSSIDIDKAYGAARSDAESKASDQYDGGITLSQVKFNWV